MKFLFLLPFAALVFAADTLPSKKTPGEISPEVTQANIRKTICVKPADMPAGQKDYIEAARPPASWTTKLKIEQMALLGLSGVPHDYEEDHRVPIEVGGAPHDERNLWPQIWPEAHLKDRLENAVHKDVCDGTLTLKAGQAIFLGNFWKEYHARFDSK